MLHTLTGYFLHTIIRLWLGTLRNLEYSSVSSYFGPLSLISRAFSPSLEHLLTVANLKMTSQALADAFESAKKGFLSQFPNGTPADFQEFTTINDVYKAAEEVQLAQARTRSTRNLRQIQPFLECLRHYGDIIETFVTVKPDILALIWVCIMFQDDWIYSLMHIFGQLGAYQVSLACEYFYPPRNCI